MPQITTFKIEFYEEENGHIPVEDFLLSLDLPMRAKLVGILEILQEKGNLLREPYSKHIIDGIFEVRGKAGNDIFRILYFFYYGQKIILTNGFIKKTPKTPAKQIALAKKRRAIYLERSKKS